MYINFSFIAKITLHKISDIFVIDTDLEKTLEAARQIKWKNTFPHFKKNKNWAKSKGNSRKSEIKFKIS